MCPVKPPPCANDFSHISHLKGFSPVWILMWDPISIKMEAKSVEVIIKEGEGIKSEEFVDVDKN